jgi:hypothetical protein
LPSNELQTYTLPVWQPNYTPAAHSHTAQARHHPTRCPTNATGA